MASSNASLEDAHDDQHQETKGHRKPEVTVTREHTRSYHSRDKEYILVNARQKDRKGNKKDRGRSLIRRTLIYRGEVQHACSVTSPFRDMHAQAPVTRGEDKKAVSHLRIPCYSTENLHRQFSL